MIRLVFAALISVSALGCAKLNDMFDMPKKMDNMNQEVARTNDTVERQPVVLAFEAMLKEEYAQDLWPIPFNLMGFAKEFGKYATVEDLVELFYVKIKELNEVQMELEAPTDEQIAKFNHKKQHTMVMLQAVAGLLTDAKVEQIIQQRILTDDRFAESALNLLMLRYQFIGNVLLDSSLFSDKMKHAGEVEKAVEYANSLEYLARLPFIKDIQVDITGFYEKPEATETDDNVATLDPSKVPAVWTKIKNKANRMMSVEAEEFEKGIQTNAQLHQERVRRIQNVLVIVDEKIRSWSGKP